MVNSRWQNRGDKDRYLIADIGVNHENSLNKAKLMIEQIAKAGWHCAKFQAYTAETIAQIDSPAYWDTTKETASSQYELFSKFDKFKIDDFIQLAGYANDFGIDICVSVFNEIFIKEFDRILPFYKIASSDLTNLLLIDEILETGKDIILSTGASTLEEIINTVNYILKMKKPRVRLILLHCNLLYPTPIDRADLLKIVHLIERFPDIEVGYSDHVSPSEDNLCLTTAYILDARIIEKHFTYCKALPGNDHYHAYDYHDACALVERLDKIDALLGNQDTDVTITQSSARKYARRALVAREDILEGDVYTTKNITALRPFNGISPIHWPNIKGKIAKSFVRKGSIITESDFSDDA